MHIAPIQQRLPVIKPTIPTPVNRVKSHPILSMFLIFAILTRAITEAMTWEKHATQPPTPTVLWLQSAKMICDITLIDDYRGAQHNRSTWITAADCCPAEHLILNDKQNKQSMVFKTRVIAESRWCIGDSLPYMGNPATRANEHTLPANATAKLLLRPSKTQDLTNSHEINLTSTYFAIGTPERYRLGMPLLWNDQLIGIMSRTLLTYQFFTPVTARTLENSNPLPDTLSFSFGSGFNGILTHYHSAEDTEHAEQYAYTTPTGAQVEMHHYTRYKNSSITATHRNETMAHGRHIDYDNYKEEKGNYFASRHESYESATPSSIKRYLDWQRIDGKETFRFQHRTATLTLHNAFGTCTAFKIDDSQVRYPGHDYWLTAGHCCKGNLTLKSDIDQTTHPVTMFSKNYFDSDWAVLLGSETDGPGLQITFGSHTSFSPVTHLQSGVDPIVHTLGKNGVDLSQPSFGIGHLLAKPGGSGSPILANDHVIGIQSSTFDESAMIVSQIPPRSAFQKTTLIMWDNKDLPIDALIFFDTDAVLNATGFSIRDNTEYAAHRTYTNENDVKYTNTQWMKTENGTQSSDDFSINQPFKRFLKWVRFEDQVKAKIKIEHYSDYNVTCYTLKENSDKKTCQRRTTKFSDKKILDTRGYHYDVKTEITTTYLHEEISPSGEFSYFKNIQNFPNGSMTFEHSNADEFQKGKRIPKA